MSLRTAASRELRTFRRRRLLHLLMLGYGCIWLVAALAPRDRAGWAMENLLVISLLVGLAGTYRVMAFSDLSYLCIAAFLTLHTVGAHYTYPEVPLGRWARGWFGWDRNNYDRLAHFGFGLLMAYPIREGLLRAVGVRGFLSYWLPAATILALGAAYEILEWGAAAILAPEVGSAYLGTQGDEWDAQKDMLCTVLGAALAMTTTALSRPARSSSGVAPPGRSTSSPVGQ